MFPGLPERNPGLELANAFSVTEQESHPLLATGSRYDTHNRRTRKENCNQHYPVAPGSLFVWRRRLHFCSLDLWATLALTKLNQYPSSPKVAQER